MDINFKPIFTGIEPYPFENICNSLENITIMASGFPRRSLIEALGSSLENPKYIGVFNIWVQYL